MRKLLTPLAAVGLSLILAAPLAAQSIAGPYLAARSAAIQNDFEQAASYYTRALARDPANLFLMESALVAQLAMGRLEQALPIAKTMQRAGQSGQVAQLVLTADQVINGDYDALLNGQDDRQLIGPLVDGLVEAWALIGTGDVSAALDRFDTIAAQQGLRAFAMFHKAMAMASVGDFEAADAIFSSEANGTVLQTRRGILARVEILSQLEREDEARALLETTFSGATDPEIDAVLAALEEDEPMPFSHVNSVQDGFAEVFFTVAAALRSETGPEFTILYAQTARILRPDHVDAILLTAELFESLEQYDASIEVLKEVPASHPAYHAAELGRAAALRRSGKEDAAIEVLEQLARSHGDLVSVQSALGDALRQKDRFDEAVGAYNKAIALAEEVNGTSSWFLLYARAISYERQGLWDQAEKDFRAALELNPGQPQVLNYLGYSLVEKRIKLDEALEMIERAVAASPNSGYIIDSLGWALYRLGRYEEAVPHMERAVELMAVDPIVNDHLGDVYWAVGRYREAEFQWSRALSFIDESQTVEDVDPERIRRKLEVGLDVVLEEEGGAPIEVVAD
ncbi:tetratricopeptide repeat protein [Roseobacter denitrificans]|uniref:TPR domain protein n=1 Tax=Roseobacter denitrificans (strain ATCC 33942 / OCh 114) TaxID=375451 RepID=Q163E8_ROSDO|nr:tetratricopeptide repeat protein [Roseobacter denitrificans]ABG32895.1 TPR domain protein [Roseobacter denitrificans OCh 114]AVL52288.1 tetratricopeptide repeat protein [Roseobacter denitrificans]SFG45504.1 Tetratricopeptide repeat-containing protein [Roseobacter denitrificans OCh 114]